jgi:hypothetical protein
MMLKRKKLFFSVGSVRVVKIKKIHLLNRVSQREREIEAFKFKTKHTHMYYKIYTETQNKMLQAPWIDLKLVV